ncbi:MAG: hypothetical protein U9P14_10445, partial [Gemmatimonadota bacterium]|nr:hypothetical protein [Gemmatimonadota bacterium]
SRTEKIWQTPNFVLLAGSHDGYRRLPDPVDIHRTLIYFPQILLITSDYFHALRKHVYQVSFHTRLEAGKDPENRRARFPGTAFSDVPLEVSARSGDEGPPPRGWCSSGWMQREPLPVHTFTARETGPCCLISMLWINPRESISSIERLDIFKSIDGTPGGPALSCREAWALCLKRPGDIRHIMLRPETRWQADGALPAITFGGVETDALFIMIRKNISNRSLHFSGHHVSRIADSGLSFMETGRPLRQVSGYIQEETVRLHLETLSEDEGVCDITIFSPYGERLFVNGLKLPFERDGEFVRFSYNPGSNQERL